MPEKQLWSCIRYAVLDVSVTPIFDCEQEPPEPSMPWLPKLIGSILGVVITSLLILADADQLPNWHWPACNGLLIIPALYIAVAVHELGHLTAGTLVGLDTGGIAVGGIALIKSGKNWTFRFDRRISFCGFFSPLTRTADSAPPGTPGWWRVDRLRALRSRRSSA